MRYAVIDTGSNTIRLGVYDYENDTLTQVFNTAVFANLAGYIQDGNLTQEGIRAAEEAIAAQIKTANEFGCSAHVFATAAIRNAKNTEAICKDIKTQTGADVHVLTGEEEAVFSFYGAATDFPCEEGVMADVGGGSSEIILFTGKQPIETLSVPWGSLKAYKTFVVGPLPNMQEIRSIQSAVFAALDGKQAFHGVAEKNLCIAGGGGRASKKLAMALLGEAALTTENLERMLTYAVRAPEPAKAIIGKTVPERAHTIVPTMAIYSAVCKFFGCDHLFISENGIKEGYILKKLLKQ